MGFQFQETVTWNEVDGQGRPVYPDFRGYIFGVSPDGKLAYISVVNPGGVPGATKFSNQTFPMDKIGKESHESTRSTKALHRVATSALPETRN